ncbi:MAG: Two-component transcriptional response regulator, LuxR family [uncultured Rubrobacteraceae bacterium]|uniref:Two-component transcriptional response regulator, LuxR family n=1 Tax=uncultured Rubrobacteraceae bacterium TaxID=349277 RepID=A0A6J4QCL6_9ACTN|nr:MAG: Two-component transcriptional response regulator, LuxR family [uncultured Rubrobacteraceae bacterium]
MKKRDGHIKVLLVDDHALFREGVVEIFAVEDGMRVVGEAENGVDAIALAQREKPDVVLLDVEMPVMGAEGAIEEILRVSLSSKVLVLTMYDEPRLVRKLLRLGAHAYIVKNATREELVAAVRTVHRVEDRVVLSVSRTTADRLEGSDRGTLSGRELEVLLLTVRAMSNSQIAAYLHISEGTVKRHLTNIYAKLGVSSRADAAKKALTSGLITFRDLSEPGR